MASYFAKIEDKDDAFNEGQTRKVVTNIIVTDDDQSGAEGEEWCANTLGGVYKETRKKPPFARRKPATIGDYYNEDQDTFSAPQPFASWTFNTETNLWEAPIPYPTIEEYESTVTAPGENEPPLPPEYPPVGDPILKAYDISWNETEQRWEALDDSLTQFTWDSVNLIWNSV